MLLERKEKYFIIEQTRSIFAWQQRCRFMKIVTLTLNPAIDKSTTLDRIVPEKKLRCSPARYEPGGGGINVSRVLKRLGTPSLAAFTSGGPMGLMLEGLVKKEGLNYEALPIQEWTRESFAVSETSTGQQYRFGMPGPTLTEREWKSVLSWLASLSPAPEFLVLSGSLPPGVPDEAYAQIAEWARLNGIKVVLDTSGPSLEKALDTGVFLVKPNLSELAGLVNKSAISGKEQESIASMLVHSGRAQMVVVSLGARGAMLAHAGGIHYAVPPTIVAKSTIGAGDSTVAGMIWALAQGYAPQALLRYGVACGTAATMNTGTELCRPDDVQQLFEWMGGVNE